MAKMVKPEVQIIRFGVDVIATSPITSLDGTGAGPNNTPGPNPGNVFP